MAAAMSSAFLPPWASSTGTSTSRSQRPNRTRRMSGVACQPGVEEGGQVARPAPGRTRRGTRTAGAPRARSTPGAPSCGTTSLRCETTRSSAQASHAAHELVGAEGPLARGAPDVDALGVEHQHPGVAPRERAPQPVEAQLVVGRDEDRRLGVGLAHRVEPGRHAVAACGRCPSAPSRRRGDREHRARSSPAARRPPAWERRRRSSVRSSRPRVCFAGLHEQQHGAETFASLAVSHVIAHPAAVIVSAFIRFISRSW